MALALGLGASAQAETAPDWPRRFDNADGTQTTLTVAPRRVLSTSVTVSGTLLAIDAPLIASAGGANGRFFDQWAPVARERGLTPLWPAGQVDLEAAYAARPDLIIVSATGADSAREQLDALRAIAPVIVVDYSHQTWQELAVQLGRALGIEAAAARAIADFDARVAAARARLRIPKAPSTSSATTARAPTIPSPRRPARMRACWPRWASGSRRPIRPGTWRWARRAISSGRPTRR